MPERHDGPDIVQTVGNLEVMLAATQDIGGGPDGGWTRLAWTPEDAAMRQWFVEEATERGLTVEVDRNGNQWAWHGDPRSGEAIVTGSHLDSVPNGGQLDGPLGVMSAFLAFDHLVASGVHCSRPLGIVNFCDEEGGRFGVACIGSQLATGAVQPERVLKLADKDGVTLRSAMTAAGHDPEGLGQDDERLARIDTFVELHIEQGVQLSPDDPYGIASGIWPHGRWLLTLDGAADHAGTTRLQDRRDPMLPFAFALQHARTVAEQCGARATIGRAFISPNGANVIPNRVRCWIDVRAPREEDLTFVIDRIAHDVSTAAASHGVESALRMESFSPAVVFDQSLNADLHQILGEPPQVASLAGHDAGILSAAVRSTMLLVRNPSGTSHAPHETIEISDAARSVGALSAVLRELLQASPICQRTQARLG
ncbi:allantoate amidohydrolase [Nocardioidaceae bacterium SCSIO 66511]|nr:allantoate amidohydrolase [Nocardioidaceae bacterium SCSIO 66511]